MLCSIQVIYTVTTEQIISVTIVTDGLRSQLNPSLTSQTDSLHAHALVRNVQLVHETRPKSPQYLLDCTICDVCARQFILNVNKPAKLQNV